MSHCVAVRTGRRSCSPCRRRRPRALKHRFRTAVLILAGASAICGGAGHSAWAANATLWACHGPGGQALGSGPFVDGTAGDGALSSYGGGCSAPATTLTDGGFRAGFTRPDPVGASSAVRRLDVPIGVTLKSVMLTRANRGFGGPSVGGGGQYYATETSAGTLESTRVDDASNTPLNGSLSSDPAFGDFVRIGVRCGLPASSSCAAPSSSPIAIEVGRVALNVSDASPPLGAVGGLRSPAAGTLEMVVRATDSGLGLRDLRATIDDQLAGVALLAGADCAELSPQNSSVDLPLDADCPFDAIDAPLSVDTTHFTDGDHLLKVTASDAAGNTTTIAQETVRISNAHPPNKATAILGVAGGTPGSPSVGGSGGGGSSGVAGSVPSVLRLSIRRQPAGFGSFKRKGTSAIARIPVEVTASVAPTILSISDGDFAGGPRRGFLSLRGRKLALPLEAGLGRRLVPLATAVGAPLRNYAKPIGAKRATIRLRQRLRKTDRRKGPYRKTVVVTLGVGTP